MIHDTRANAGRSCPGIQSSSPRGSARCPAHARHRALAAQPPRHEPHRRRGARASLPDLQGRDRRERRHALAAVLLAALQAGRSRRVAERVVPDPRRGAGRRRGPAARRGTERDLSDGPRVTRRPRVSPGRRASSRSPAPRGRARPRDRPARARGARRPVRATPRSRARSRPGPESWRQDARASRAPVPAPRNRRRRAGDREDACVGRQERRHGGPSRHDGTGVPLYLQRSAQPPSTTQTDAHHDPVRECPRSTSRAKAASCIAGSPTMRCDTCTRPRRMSGSLVKENGRSAARSVVPVLGNAADRVPRNR